MYKVNKVLVIPSNPHKVEPVDLTILNLIEKTLKLPYPISHIDKQELPRRGNNRRFMITNVYGYRDK